MGANGAAHGPAPATRGRANVRFFTQTNKTMSAAVDVMRHAMGQFAISKSETVGVVAKVAIRDGEKATVYGFAGDETNFATFDVGESLGKEIVQAARDAGAEGEIEVAVLALDTATGKHVIGVLDNQRLSAKTCYLKATEELALHMAEEPAEDEVDGDNETPAHDEVTPDESTQDEGEENLAVPSDAVAEDGAGEEGKQAEKPRDLKLPETAFYATAIANDEINWEVFVMDGAPLDAYRLVGAVARVEGLVAHDGVVVLVDGTVAETKDASERVRSALVDIAASAGVAATDEVIVAVSSDNDGHVSFGVWDDGRDYDVAAIFSEVAEEDIELSVGHEGETDAPVEIRGGSSLYKPSLDGQTSFVRPAEEAEAAVADEEARGAGEEPVAEDLDTDPQEPGEAEETAGVELAGSVPQGEGAEYAEDEIDGFAATDTDGESELETDGAAEVEDDNQVVVADPESDDETETDGAVADAKEVAQEVVDASMEKIDDAKDAVVGAAGAVAARVEEAADSLSGGDEKERSEGDEQEDPGSEIPSAEDGDEAPAAEEEGREPVGLTGEVWNEPVKSGVPDVDDKNPALAFLDSEEERDPFDDDPIEDLGDEHEPHEGRAMDFEDDSDPLDDPVEYFGTFGEESDPLDDPVEDYDGSTSGGRSDDTAGDFDNDRAESGVTGIDVLADDLNEWVSNNAGDDTLAFGVALKVGLPEGSLDDSIGFKCLPGGYIETDPGLTGHATKSMYLVADDVASRHLGEDDGVEAVVVGLINDGENGIITEYATVHDESVYEAADQLALTFAQWAVQDDPQEEPQTGDADDRFGTLAEKIAKEAVSEIYAESATGDELIVVAFADYDGETRSVLRSGIFLAVNGAIDKHNFKSRATREMQSDLVALMSSYTGDEERLTSVVVRDITSGRAAYDVSPSAGFERRSDIYDRAVDAFGRFGAETPEHYSGPRGFYPAEHGHGAESPAVEAVDNASDDLTAIAEAVSVVQDQEEGEKLSGAKRDAEEKTTKVKQVAEEKATEAKQVAEERISDAKENASEAKQSVEEKAAEAKRVAEERISDAASKAKAESAAVAATAKEGLEQAAGAAREHLESAKHSLASTVEGARGTEGDAGDEHSVADWSEALYETAVAHAATSIAASYARNGGTSRFVGAVMAPGADTQFFTGTGVGGDKIEAAQGADNVDPALESVVRYAGLDADETVACVAVDMETGAHFALVTTAGEEVAAREYYSEVAASVARRAEEGTVSTASLVGKAASLGVNAVRLGSRLAAEKIRRLRK